MTREAQDLGLVWIPVTERLPPYGREVMVTCGVEVGHCVRDHSDEFGDHWTTVGAPTEEFFDVVGWRELPPIPKWANVLAGKRAAAKKKRKARK